MSDATPTPKVGGGVVAAANVTIAVWIVGLYGLTVPAEVAAAATTLIGFGVAYLIPDRTSPARHRKEN